MKTQDIIEKRQLEAEEELKDIKNCGWLEEQSDLIIRQVQAILQAEYQLYGISIQVLTDYYAALEKWKLPKCEIPQIDLVLEGLNPSEAIDCVIKLHKALHICQLLKKKKKLKIQKPKNQHQKERKKRKRWKKQKSARNGNSN